MREYQVAALLAAGNFGEALEGALSALEGDPENAELLNLAGICASRLADLGRAESLWEKAASVDERASRPCFNLGMLHAVCGNPEQAEHYYRLAISRDGGNEEALVNLGALLMGRGAGAEAEQCFRRAMEIEPGNASACANLALLLERLGRMEEAARHHLEAVRLCGDSAQIRFNHANFLAGSNRKEDVEEAKSAFLETIRIQPDHFGAWNNLGNLLFETGSVAAAQTAYSAAAHHHPGEVAARVNLGNVLLYREEPESAEKQFAAALEIDPDLPEAHQGLASVFHRKGEGETAELHRKQGYGARPVSFLPCRGRGDPVSLLVLASSLEGNVPWRLLIDQGFFGTTIVAVEYFDGELPSHDLVFNAIGDADLCREGLEIACGLVEKTKAPVINSPDSVLNTGRIENSARLSLLPGVRTPNAMRFSRDGFRSEWKGEFPLLLRAPGYHGGNHFVKVESIGELEKALDSLPGKELLAMDFLDPHTPDGLFRKYRVMSIGGTLYPLHMAVSSSWKVHYFSSDMEKNGNYRLEEAAFLEGFPECLGKNAIDALEGVARTLGLDYCGMDFGMDEKGNLLLYEANATMAIVPPSQEKEWDYRRGSVEKTLAAARRLFTERIS